MKNFWKVKGTEIEIGSIDVLFKVEEQCCITLLYTCIPFAFLAIIPLKYLCNYLTGFFFFFWFLLIPYFPHVTEDMKYRINLIWTLYFYPGLSWPWLTHEGSTSLSLRVPKSLQHGNFLYCLFWLCLGNHSFLALYSYLLLSATDYWIS